MDATTMPQMALLVKKLSSAYPQFHFEDSDHYMWAPAESTVYFNSEMPNPAQLLHELGHGVRGHGQYNKDVALLAMEREAWEEAKRIGQQFDVTIDDDTIETHLDTYRDWLHARSTCPSCNATGVQTSRFQYRCVACFHEWRVNDARICALRRYAANTKTR